MPKKIQREPVPEYPPHALLDYALLADGVRGVLVGPRGEFAWMCAPRWDSDAVFSSLIGGEGIYAVTPENARYVWGGYYEERSLIWRSRWVTTTGTVECREALAFPGDPHTAVILRRVSAVEGTAAVRSVLDARAGFGREEMTDVHRRQGIWTARSGALHLRWRGAGEARARRGGGLETHLVLEPGTHHDLVLEISDQVLDTDPRNSADLWEATESSWFGAVPNLGSTLAPRDASHAYAVLRGLTTPGGGMVAAATMSLPERAEEGRNYDYRYSVVRDQSYAGQAAAVLKPLPLLDDAVTFVSERILADGPGLKPAYRVDGGSVPSERSLAHLAGYPGGSNKVGNWVNRQFQLDTLGEALLLFAAAGRHEHLDATHWSAVETNVEAIGSRWQEPDAGVWELNNRRWTESRLVCVAGLRAIAPFAPPAQGSTWTGLADAIAADVASDCVHPSGRWQRAPDDDRIDASLLIPMIRGALPPHDPRNLATLDAISKELASDGYLYRFRHDERPLEDAEGAFVFCGFLMSLALHQQGEVAEARAWFERNRAASGPPGLFSEEIDLGQRQLRGNLPQAFVHALLLECAARLPLPWPQT